ncbi:hypothetical protein CBS101457_000165 [Exobasidium rhododendri]|nr:hypothetical protein CBS101457_000165 [Exobasidium rhododendri]
MIASRDSRDTEGWHPSAPYSSEVFHQPHQHSHGYSAREIYWGDEQACSERQLRNLQTGYPQTSTSDTFRETEASSDEGNATSPPTRGDRQRQDWSDTGAEDPYNSHSHSEEPYRNALYDQYSMGGQYNNPSQRQVSFYPGSNSGHSPQTYEDGVEDNDGQDSAVVYTDRTAFEEESHKAQERQARKLKLDRAKAFVRSYDRIKADPRRRDEAAKMYPKYKKALRRVNAASQKRSSSEEDDDETTQAFRQFEIN